MNSDGEYIRIPRLTNGDLKITHGVKMAAISSTYKTLKTLLFGI